MAGKGAMSASAGGVVTYKIKSEGQELPGEYLPFSIRVSKELNRISYARIEFYEGGVGETVEYGVTESGFFEPGKEITIQLGYSSDDEDVFTGIVTKHAMKVTESGSFMLQIECRDKATKMTIGRKNQIFNEKSDSDIIKQLIEGNGLTAKVDATSTKHPEMVQHYATDWDFVMTRAEANNLVVVNADGGVTVVAPSKPGGDDLEARFGQNILAFEGAMDARTQHEEVSAVSWDQDTQEIVESTSTTARVDAHQGNVTSSALSDAIGNSVFHMQSGANVPQSVLQAWSDAKIQKSRLSKICGTIKILGIAKAAPNTYIEIEGLSPTFDGTAFISGVSHAVEEGTWVTELHIGLSEKWYTEQMSEIEAPSASGLIPGIKGLHIGKVKQIHDDPNGEFRVKVAVPELQQDNMPIWARMSNMYSSLETGFFFMPEVDDEVILGFLNNDPNYPVILGSLYNKMNTPMYTPTEENEIKSILTKSKLEIKFDEKLKILTLTTPGVQQIVLDDDAKSITLTDDANKNKVVLGSDGILLESQKDIVMKAQGNITLTATGNAEIKATGDFAGEGMNVALKGSASFAAEGPQAELKGSAMTTISGGIVQIN
ncbi:type VI secretion system tip protein VgrG [Reichenbachiella carrageenanivorans]|uniref:Type VI secretion system tip protein VgrG n=1 Tax=Reichenbachiella carrageenanivorans TaxID=2979869 RepID=A0ABY6CWL4_9BACT|nr:type VI secretion system tip protein VgrG [Reichenbachiella carrageenanivorans]UXX77734.1 type VI secretion system tip protein VgrG [Reichenbachiella carrageenanivorans]